VMNFLLIHHNKFNTESVTGSGSGLGRIAAIILTLSNSSITLLSDNENVMI